MNYAIKSGNKETKTKEAKEKTCDLIRIKA